MLKKLKAVHSWACKQHQWLVFHQTNNVELGEIIKCGNRWIFRPHNGVMLTSEYLLELVELIDKIKAKPEDNYVV